MNMLNRRCYGPCCTSRQRAARQGLSWLVAICTMCAVVRLQATSPGVDPALKAGRSKPGTPEFSDVFIAGKDGFKSIRIPSVVVTKKGTVLAIAEGRAQHADQANNKLILKRSTDGGRTWGPLQLIADDGANCLNNPCAVVEQETGRVIVMYQSYPAGLSERDGKIQPGLDGPAIVRNYVVHSDDDGVTWSKPEDVTRTTKTPERVTIVASGPGIGIQLRQGRTPGGSSYPSTKARSAIGTC